MIQRIQSLYLLLSSLFYFNYWFFGMEWFKKGFFILQDVFAEIIIPDFIFIIISFIPLLIVTICIISILLFRNRRSGNFTTEIFSRINSHPSPACANLKQMIISG